MLLLLLLLLPLLLLLCLAVSAGGWVFLVVVLAPCAPALVIDLILKVLCVCVGGVVVRIPTEW